MDNTKVDNYSKSKAAIGEEIDNETLGGSKTHCDISGVVDYECKNDNEAILTIRELIQNISTKRGMSFSKIESKPPLKNINDIYGILPKDRDTPYEMKEILERIVDDSYLREYKANYGKTLICAYARLDGWSIGIIGTRLGATFLSLIRLVNILTNTIVVDISFSPVDSFIFANISGGGVFIAFANEDLSGKKPPNLIRHSFKYFISGEFSFGL